MGIPRPDRFGRYEPLLELGRGGMAELYLARLHGAGGFAKLVAIKRILPHLAEDKHFVELFLNEGRIAAHLSHPNVCQVYELDEQDGELFLVMEYLEGVSWDALAAAATPGEPALRLATTVVGQACAGLHHAHTLRDAEGQPRPIVHRDVSPQNLFVTVDGVCKVLDFGVSKMLTDGPRTRTGVLKGKLPYMAPEQIQGEAVDGRADIWALGVVLWEALTGERLFDRDTDFLIWKAITEAVIPKVSPRGYPVAIDTVIARALERDKAMRYATAQQLADDLQRIVPQMPPRELAREIRALCGDRLTQRSQQVAEVITERREAVPADANAPSASESASASVTINEPGETVSLRGESVPLELPPRRRSRAIVGVIAAGVIAVIATVIAIVATRSSTSSPTAGPVVAAVATDASVPAVVAFDAPAPTIDKKPAPLPAHGHPHPAIVKPPPIVKQPAVTPPVVGEPPPRPLPAPGLYTIDSTPYATIYVDDRSRGDTPLYRIQLSPGPHRVRAVLADGRERTFQITIEPGQELSSGKLAW